jgi:DNA-directed RNA polymerase subunit beta'
MKLSYKKKQEFDLLNFDAIKISLASPEQIREMSYGEVKKTETLNYKTLKPERDGLFCEKIFGPIKDYECSCGKYKRTMAVTSPTMKQVVCNRCGVEVTTSKVRRERMGHIELVVPVAHFWYFGKSPSKIATFLDMSQSDIKDIVYGLIWVTVKDVDDIKNVVAKSIEEMLQEKVESEIFGTKLSKIHIDVLYYIMELKENKIPLPRKLVLGYKEKHLLKLFSNTVGLVRKFLQNFKKDKTKNSYLLTKLGLKDNELQIIVDDLLKLVDYIENKANIYIARKIVEHIIEDEKYTGNLADPKNYLKENVSVLTNAEALYRLLRDEGKEENLRKELENIKQELKELYKQENTSRTILLFEKYKDIEVYKEDAHVISKIKTILGLSTKQSPEFSEENLTKEINKLKSELISHIEKGISSEILSELSVLFKKYSISIQPSPERSKLINRSKLIESFLYKNIKPEWMILTVLPVLPPDLRPLVAIEGGKFASSDLNEFYRRIIHRNNRLRKFFSTKEGSGADKEITVGGVPKPVLLNEKRLLQEAVDALIENSAKKHPVMMNTQKRPLKSLTDILKGKQGRFRQNLLGKRIDYSGRSTIAVGPELKLYQCGLPKEMAYELFKPFLIHKLMKKLNVTLKKAKNMVDKKVSEIWDLLEEITKHHVVLLNRAPTLHTPSIQAFEPVLVDGKAILIHPMVCTPYNADFDGDQMGVYVPLTLQALAETKLLMTSYFSLFSPANGKVLIGPTQDVVLGVSYLTAVKDGEKGEGKIFSSIDEAIHAYQQGIINLNSKIKVAGITDLEIKYEDGKPDYSITKEPTKWQSYTTVGRLIFNSILPKELSLLNESLPPEEKEKRNRMFGKTALFELVKEIYQKLGAYETVKFLDELKKLGYHYATVSGFTISVDDMIIPKGKLEKIKEAQQRVKEVEDQAKEGIITEKERYNSVIDIWSDTIDKITKEMINEMEKVAKEPYKYGNPRFNPVYFMAQSGARGNMDQVRQLSAIRGLMSRPQRKIMGEIGEIIETPILSNFREGLSVLEYFISTHGGRKGLSDTALKTSEAGYLTRRLVDVAHHVVVTEEDCGTINRIKVSALKVGDDVIESLSERIAGRVAADDITYEIMDEKTNQVVVKVVKAGEIITEQQAKEIEKSGLYESIRIRSVLTCESKRGVCAKCYGMDLSTGKLVEVGKPVGIIAAQSIGEPGTQLTLRTFHIGGAAARLVKQSQIRAPYDGKIEYFSEASTKSETSEQIHKFKTIQKKDETTGKTFWIVLTSDAILRFVYTTPKGEKKREIWRLEYGTRIYVKDGQEVKKDELIADWDLYSIPIISEKKGIIKYRDLKENRTYVVEQISSGNLEKRVLPHRGKENPRLDVVNDKGKVIATYTLPADTVILVEDGQEINEGDIVAKIPKGEIKTKDITGGLPRVEELFEARHPENSAILAEIDGIVKIETREKEDKKTDLTKTKEQQNIEISLKIVNPKTTKEVKIPSNRIPLVYDGDKVEAGEPLTDGVIDPHKYLEIRGPHHLQEFFLNEIQQVYRLQGVNINDKHIEIIVKQMLSFVRITDPGLPPKPRSNKKFYEFIYGEIVPKKLFEEEVEKINEEKRLLKKEGKHKEADEICPPKAEPVLLGISTVSIWSESFLSAASFQETSRVLTDAAVEGKVDNLVGLKENVIIGRLIPAGTGFYSKESLSLIRETEEELVSRIVE